MVLFSDACLTLSASMPQYGKSFSVVVIKLPD